MYSCFEKVVGIKRKCACDNPEMLYGWRAAVRASHL